MGILRTIGKAVATGLGGAMGLRDGGEAAGPIVVPSGIWPDSDMAVDALTASSVACVKRCVDVKAGAVASLGLHV